MGDSFWAEGENQFQYNSLKYSFQEFKPEHSSNPEPAPSSTSSDDIIPDPAPSISDPKPIHNVPKHVSNIPAPQPNPPACHPCQPKPPPHEPSSHHIKPTSRGDSSHLQKV